MVGNFASSFHVSASSKKPCQNVVCSSRDRFLWVSRCTSCWSSLIRKELVSRYIYDFTQCFTSLEVSQLVRACLINPAFGCRLYTWFVANRNAPLNRTHSTNLDWRVNLLNANPFVYVSMRFRFYNKFCLCLYFVYYPFSSLSTNVGQNGV